MRRVEIEVEEEDDDFLNHLAAAEAEALSSSSAKRRKITTTTTTTTTNTNNSSYVSNSNPSSLEGAYIAALKGSRSLLFQHQFANATTPKPNAPSAFAIAGSAAAAAGSCFKCGKSGHWAKDCDSNSNASASANSYSYSSSSSSVDSSSVPEKACPCGLGACLVLTANTEKNRGRKFYKCPIREESGGCGFFEWCDKSSGTDYMNNRSQSYTLNRSIPELCCPCGAGSCPTLTAKTGKNIGQQFYRCPASQENCGFFKWCNDHTTTTTTAMAGLSDSKVYKNNFSEMGNKNYGGSGGSGGGSSCFKCGKDGHWSKDCSGALSNTCFKCGKPGHWAKDCSSSANPRGSENCKIRY